MDIQKYINSGILEQYCLGLLDKDEQANIVEMSLIYPEIKQEIADIEQVIEKITASKSIPPPIGIKQKIMNLIELHESPFDVNNLPDTHKYSNHQNWLNAVEHLMPAEPFDDFSMQILRHNDRVAQMLVISKTDVPKETHEDIAESFFILKGACVCQVGEHLFKLSPGDYLDIPLHVEHDVKLLTPYVIAILQHQFV